MALEDGLEQVKGETTESVSVGNHNLVDSSLEDAFQKGLQSSALEVEARPDVAEDAVEGVAPLEVLDLPLEVFLLVRGADAGVDDFFLLGALIVAVVAEELEDVVSEVQALASG